MNRLMEMEWSWIEGTHGMRTQLLDSLSDADLAFNPGGQNMTFGALLREIGEIEHSYLQSLKTFKLDFTYRNPEAGLERSVAQLKTWYQALLIFFGKVVVYLRAMNRPLPQPVQDYIA